MSNSENNNLRAVVLPTNAEALVIWMWDGVIPDCLGFSLRRHNLTTGVVETLSSRLVKFKGEGKQTAKTTLDTHPIQGSKWSDGKVVVGQTYKWEVVPMIGTPGNLKAGESTFTKEVTIGYDYGAIKACFNRGHLVSTQALAEMLGVDPATGKPDEAKFLAAINDPDSTIFKWLSAGLYDFAKLPLEEAKQIGGHLYYLLYELSFPPFVEYLRQNKKLWSMVLSNAGKGDETNAPTAKIFEDEGDCDVTRRIIPEGKGLGHNKLGVLADKEDKPTKTLCLSANSTATGFASQANHALLIEGAEAAAVCKDYYDRTLADCDADPIQSDEYRATNRKVAEAAPVILSDGTSVQFIFSPCTTEREKPRTPADGRTFPLLDIAPTMKVAKEVLLGAKQGIYGVAFYPGTPSVVDVISYIAFKRPSLPVHFTVSSTQALPKPPRKPKTGAVKGSKSMIDTGEGHPEAITDGLVQTEGGLIVPASAIPEKTQVAVFQPRKKFPTIIAAAALEEGYEDWIKELLKLSNAHAVTHAKFVAVDPWGDDPILIGAASDNMGLRAACCNDEVFLVIRNNRKLVQAYATFALGVKSHFLWRFLVKSGQATFTGELASDTSWQNRFLKGKGRKEYEQMIARTE